MINIRSLLMAAAVSVGVAFAMPMASQAMPVSAPVKMQAAKDTNIVEAKHKKRWKKHKRWRESRRWRHHRFARYCDPWDGCYRRRHSRFYRYWDEPYYGGYPYYYGGGYPYYRGGYPYGGYGPGVGLYFRF